MANTNISDDILNRMRMFENIDAARPNSSLTASSTFTDSKSDILDTKMMMSTPPPGVQTDENGLILPKKIINPCLENSERKQLHRELKFTAKAGISVLNQKSELQRAYEKQKERQQLHQVQDSSPTGGGLSGELNRVILERAQKQESSGRNSDSSGDDESQYVNPEYLNARAKLRAGQRSELK